MKFGSNPRKTLTRLVALNIVFDVIAVAVWTAMPSSGGNLHYINTVAVSIEAAVAAALFAVVLYGFTKKMHWAPKAVIAITLAQRAFATVVFFPSPGIIATLVWSLIIVYFAYKTIKAETA